MAARQFAAGEVVFREGDPSESAYVIRQGRVEIIKRAPHGEVLLATLEAGAIFGELGLVEDVPRSATARALEDTMVEVYGQAELQQMMASCAEPLRTIIRVVFERLRTTNKRLSEKEAAIVHVECDFREITIMPDCERLQGLSPLTVTLGQLPLVIGGYPRTDEQRPRMAGHVFFPSDGPPLLISKRHLRIEVQDGKYVYLIDQASRYGTVVNGKAIGKGKGLYKIPLQKGEFLVEFGGVGSPYRLKLQCV